MAGNDRRGSRQNPLPGWTPPIPHDHPTATPAQKRAYRALKHRDPERASFWQGQKGPAQRAVAVEALLNSLLASPDDLDTLGEQSEILWLVLRHIDFAYEASPTDLAAMREELLADLRAIAARATGEVPGPDSADRLNTMRALAESHTRYVPGGVDAEQTTYFIAGERPTGRYGIDYARQVCGEVLRFLEGIARQGLFPRECEFDRCKLGTGGGRRWFVPTRRGEGHKCCCERCRKNQNNPEPKRGPTDTT